MLNWKSSYRIQVENVDEDLEHLQFFGFFHLKTKKFKENEGRNCFQKSQDFDIAQYSQIRFFQKKEQG